MIRPPALGVLQRAIERAAALGRAVPLVWQPELEGACDLWGAFNGATRREQARFLALHPSRQLQILGLGSATVVRQWRFARSWLRTQLDEGGEYSPN